MGLVVQYILILVVCMYIYILSYNVRAQVYTLLNAQYGIQQRITVNNWKKKMLHTTLLSFGLFYFSFSETMSIFIFCVCVCVCLSCGSLLVKAFCARQLYTCIVISDIKRDHHNVYYAQIIFLKCRLDDTREKSIILYIYIYFSTTQ